MEKGQRRKEIMEECPEEFEDRLKNFIDDIEGAADDIAGKLDIDKISELDQIEEAHALAEELADSLY